MPDIRYVCLSDMHLGADNSILTTLKPDSIEVDTSKPAPVLCHLVACLRQLIEQNESARKPTLLLNGDILEMALSDVNKAAMAFERFIELVFPPDREPLFDKQILYIPGNHDHHIWESARETQYVNFLSRISPGSELEAPWHATKIFTGDFVQEFFMTSLLRRYRHLQDAVVNVVYPNYAVMNDASQRCILFSHGHYIESIYSLMSTLNTMFFPQRKEPGVIGELEAENFAWVDFFWSTMGRSGDVGQDIGLFYAKMQDEHQFKELLTNFTTSLVKKGGQAGWLEKVEEEALKLLLTSLLARRFVLERQRPDRPLSQDAQRGLNSFISGPVLTQILSENHQTIPEKITFIFGHTHKPFQKQMNFVGYPNPINVYNTGGWVVDKVQVHPVYGAAVILIDENLYPLSLRMYNQTGTADTSRVQVTELLSEEEPPSAFYKRIQLLVEPSSNPWKGFSNAVAEAVQRYAQALQIKINQ